MSESSIKTLSKLTKKYNTLVQFRHNLWEQFFNKINIYNMLN